MKLTCKRGTHPRKSYTRKAYMRKTGVHIAPGEVHSQSCVRGYHGPGKGIGPLKKGNLTKYGYSTSKSSRSRHTALNAAVKYDGALPTYKRLNALSVYTRRSAPATSKAALADRNYIGLRYGYKST